MEIGKIQTSKTMGSISAMSWSIRGEGQFNEMGLLKNDNMSAPLSDQEIIIGAKYAVDSHGNAVSIQFLIAELP